jgi:hypothetical protein
METKEREKVQGSVPTNQKRIRWSQEGIGQYNELFKEAALNQKESWAIDCSRKQS